MDQWTPPSQAASPDGVVELEVDAVYGNDLVATSTPGQHPFKTIMAAIAAARVSRRGGTRPVHVVLKGGQHFLSHTVSLGPEDSYLTIRNADGEHAVVSGGVNITTNWKPSDRCVGCFEADLSGQVEEMLGLRRNNVREIRARCGYRGNECGIHMVHNVVLRYLYFTLFWAHCWGTDPNFDPELDMTVNGTTYYHDGRTGWVTENTELVVYHVWVSQD